MKKLYQKVLYKYYKRIIIEVVQVIKGERIDI